MNEPNSNHAFPENESPSETSSNGASEVPSSSPEPSPETASHQPYKPAFQKPAQGFQEPPKPTEPHEEKEAPAADPAVASTSSASPPKNPKPNSNNKSFLRGLSEYNQFVLVVVLAVLMMVASNLFFFKVDLTASNMYSLSPVSKGLVANLVMPLQVKVFFSKELPPPHNNTEKYLRDLLNEYNAAGNRYFSYRFYDCSVDKESSSEVVSENIKEANSYNIYPIKLQDIEKDKVQVKLAYMGLVVQHGDMIERMSSINDVYALEYRITQIINKMNNKVNFLAGLQNDIKVRLVYSSSLEPIAPHINIKSFSAVPNRIKEVVQAASKRNYQKINYEHLDPSKNPNDEAQLADLGLNAYSFRWRKQNNQIDNVSGYAHLVIQHEDNLEVIKLIKIVTLPIFGTQYSFENLDNLEEKLNNQIDTMLDINDKIAYISNKASLSLQAAPPRGFNFQASEDGDGANFNRMLSKLYSIESINADELTKDYKALIVAGAKETFTDWELFLIDQFLMSGRSVIVFHDAFQQSTNQQSGFMGQQLPTYEPLHNGLEDMLAHYGVLVKKELVLDMASYEQMLPQSQGGGLQAIHFVPRLLQEGINQDFIAFKGINELYMNRPSLVEVDEEKAKESGLQFTQLLNSSDRSWTLKDKITLVPSYLVPPREEDKMKSHSLAYMVEGRFRSYFAEKGIPVKTEDDEDDHGDDAEKKPDSKKSKEKDVELASQDGNFIKEGRPAKLFVMGTSGNINNEIVAKEGELAPNPIIRANAAFIMNLIDYMNNKKDWALMRAKGSMRNPLVPYDENSSSFLHRVFAKRSTLKNFNIYALPAAMIAVGLLFYLRRRGKKRRLQLLFRQAQPTS